MLEAIVVRHRDDMLGVEKDGEGSPGFSLPLLTLGVLLCRWKIFTSKDGDLLG